MGATRSQNAVEEDPVRLEHVILNVYDLGTSLVVPRMNTALSFLGTGAFHVGVEVFGEECSFAVVLAEDGRACEDGKTGVIHCLPRSATGHTFRESVLMGFTALPRAGVQRVLQRLAKEWQSASYHVLARNCVHFSDSLLHELGVGPMPDVYRRLTDYSLAACENFSLSIPSLPRALIGRDERGAEDMVCNSRTKSPSILQCCAALAEELPWAKDAYPSRARSQPTTRRGDVSRSWDAHRYAYSPACP